MERYDLLVVGAGVIGLAAAWHEARLGARVALVDPHPGRGASYAAAGMLAPVTEAAFGEEGLVEFSLHSATAWPGFAETLEQESGLSVGLVRSGTLLVGVDASDRDFLEQLRSFHGRLGLVSSFCLPSECRTHEPLLAAAISGGLYVRDDLQVDNRRLLAALAEAARRAGVETVRARVLSLDGRDGAIVGVTTELGAISAGKVLIAAGAATPGLVGAEVAPVSAVKGQILRLRTPEEGPRLSRTVRAIVEGRSIYIVPRADGRVVVGATVETRGEAATTTVGGVYELLRDATAVLPALKEFELLEAFAAARPGTPDNAPLVGATATPGLFLATGHYRHGFLFAPATVEVLGAVLAGAPAPLLAAAVDPLRFAPSPAVAS